MQPVDVLIPIHGRAPFLLQTLDSIAKQDYRGKINIYCILDRVDCSVKQILNDFNFRGELIVLHSPSPGIAHALNHGIKHSDSDLIFRIDCDDLMNPSRISRQVLEFVNEDTLFVGSAIQLIDENGKAIGAKFFPLKSNEIRNFMLFTNPFAHPSMCVRRSAFLKAGGYRSFYEPAEDFDLWLRVFDFGFGTNIQETLTSYRVHGNQISNTSRLIQIIAREAAIISHGLRLKGLPELHNNYLDLDVWYQSIRTSRNFKLRAKIWFQTKIWSFSQFQRVSKILKIFLIIFFYPLASLKCVMPASKVYIWDKK